MKKDQGGRAGSACARVEQAPSLRCYPVVKHVSCFGARDGIVELKVEGEQEIETFQKLILRKMEMNQLIIINSLFILI